MKIFKEIIIIMLLAISLFSCKKKQKVQFCAEQSHIEGKDSRYYLENCNDSCSKYACDIQDLLSAGWLIQNTMKDKKPVKIIDSMYNIEVKTTSCTCIGKTYILSK